MHISWHRALLVVVAATATVCIAPAVPQRMQTLSGQVLDSSDNPVKDARIRISRGSEPMIEGKSGPDGAYKLNFQSGKPIDTVEYELTGWDRAVISGLSGGRDHSVNKTLYPAGSGAAQVRQLDITITNSLVKGDLAFFGKATSNDYIAATSKGFLSKEDILSEYRSGLTKFESHEPSQLEVRVHGDAAVVLGLVRGMMGEARERQTRTYRFMRAYAREQGGWKLIASQQMQVPDRVSGAELHRPSLGPR